MTPEQADYLINSTNWFFGLATFLLIAVAILLFRILVILRSK